jgi:hypothetical protein
VLNAGAGQTLSVTFTPDDAANYTTATATVAITVLSANSRRHDRARQSRDPPGNGHYSCRSSPAIPMGMDLTYAAAGLPPGVLVDAPHRADHRGSLERRHYTVAAVVMDGDLLSDHTFTWTVYPARSDPPASS